MMACPAKALCAMAAAPRWRKLARDLWSESDRVTLMIAAIAVSLSAVGGILGAFSVLRREIAASYAGTRPASATLELEGDVPRTLVEAVRRRPGVAEAEARDVLRARVRAGADDRPLLLFVVEDFGDLRLNAFRSESGAWPPPAGALLLERAAVAMVGASAGDRLQLTLPSGARRNVPVAGLVYDPGLAPAWQERSGYAYLDRATLGLLGEPPQLHELRVLFHGADLSTSGVEARAAELASWLKDQGLAVHQIRVPPPREHPHQRQMTTVLVVMLVFAVLALILSAILVASSLAGLLARQVREIGIMKALGARSAQIAGLYAALVAGLGSAAFLVAAPLGRAGASALAGAIAKLLNFDLANPAVPHWVFAAQAAAGVGVPLLVAAVPIRRASRVAVRETLDDHGVGGDAIRPWTSRLPLPLRNALRRPARLALTLGLLSAGGAMFMTALNLLRSWELNLAKVESTRHYDLEIRVAGSQGSALAAAVRDAVPSVRAVEAWGHSPAAFARPGAVDVVRTYPDRGHGSLSVLGVPPETRLVGFPLLAGRWLSPSDDDAVVLNHGALAQAPHLRIGDAVALSLDGRPAAFRLVGVVEEIGSPGAAYVTDRAWAQAAGAEAGSSLVRVALKPELPEERAGSMRAIAAAAANSGARVEAMLPLSELRQALDGHVEILLRALLAMALVMAVVGALGLTSAMGIGVLERTRELGVLFALGATPGRVTRGLLLEALAIGGSSWALAALLSLPLTALLDGVIGNLGFLAPLPFAVATRWTAAWLGLVGAVSVLATLVPARRAAALTVREALAHL